jgi:hypothetical protein
VTHAWVDAGCRQDFAAQAALHGIDVKVDKRSDAKPGFVPVKKRWIVEQVNGTLMHRRLAPSTQAALNRACHARMGVDGEHGQAG